MNIHFDQGLATFLPKATLAYPNANMFGSSSIKYNTAVQNHELLGPKQSANHCVVTMSCITLGKALVIGVRFISDSMHRMDTYTTKARIGCGRGTAKERNRIRKTKGSGGLEGGAETGQGQGRAVQFGKKEEASFVG